MILKFLIITIFAQTEVPATIVKFIFGRENLMVKGAVAARVVIFVTHVTKKTNVKHVVL